MSTYLMGIDCGSTVAKAGIFDTDGNEIAVHGCNWNMISPHPGYYELDQNEFWPCVLGAIRGVLEKSGLQGSDITAVSFCGHGNGVYLVDEKGVLVHNSLTSSDQRALSYVDQWLGDGTYDKTHDRTMLKLWPGLTSVVTAWFCRERPDIMQKTKWIFLVNDYVRYQLTGQAGSEISTFSGSGLLNNAEKKFDRQLLDDLGIGEVYEKLAPLKESLDMCGGITREAAQATGLKEGTPVMAGLYDIVAAAVATGVVDETKVNCIVGTWCNNQYVGQKPVNDKKLFSSTVFAKPGYWLMLEGSPTSASNLEWFIREFLPEERAIAKRNNTSIYDLTNNAVKNTEADEADIIFVPFLFGTNVNPRAKAVFIGLEGWHTRAHVIRAIYEGVCFSHRNHLEFLQKFNKKAHAVRIAGGAAKSPVWVQMFADVLNMPIETTRATELGALGAAMCAGVGIGAFKDFDEAARRMVRLGRAYTPNPANVPAYDKKYQNYKRILDSLDSYWD